MFQTHNFHNGDGTPDVDKIESWVENYFHSVFNILNSFLCTVDIKEATDRMQDIPFEGLVREQLENEDEEVIKIAVDHIKELAQAEIEIMKAYCPQ
ncbi:hypothetical protein [Syntrophomonas wolfei]|jgi:hypothetical protein|uniref:hypothetical protein n=1 Tax=Syntrophomonas wolfei TaxID=863 RepID=UPI0023F01971|nr:hypothetical protein [Syntrophomonas wolfei]